MSDADGLPRRMLWRKAAPNEGGRAEHRVLVGLEMGRVTLPTGDGQNGAFPDLDPVPYAPGS